MESPFIFLALIDHFPFSVPIPVVHNFQPRYWYMDITVGKAMPLLFNKLSRLVITFLPRSNHLLISWLQLPSAVILEPKKIKSVTDSTVSLFAMERQDQMPRSKFFEYWVLSQLFRYPLSLSSRGSYVLLHFQPKGWLVSSAYLT